MPYSLFRSLLNLLLHTPYLLLRPLLQSMLHPVLHTVLHPVPYPLLQQENKYTQPKEKH